MRLLENKVGIVTGSGQGNGRAIAVAQADECAPIDVDFSEDTRKATVELIQAAGGNAAFVAVDVSKEDSVRAMVDFALTRYGSVDIACDSAAVNRDAGPIHEFEHNVFDQTLESCLANTWLCLKLEIAAAADSRPGILVSQCGL
jgi:NAD(P)-dependent dehydrogenase (short-subunit alcohol dehydrogenase family)